MRNAMTIERNDILAVIPTYNNEKTLARVIGDVRRYCTDVLVVNDGSTDSTAGIIAGAGVRGRSLLSLPSFPKIRRS